MRGLVLESYGKWTGEPYKALAGVCSPQRVRGLGGGRVPAQTCSHTVGPEDAEERRTRGSTWAEGLSPTSFPSAGSLRKFRVSSRELWDSFPCPASRRQLCQLHPLPASFSPPPQAGHTQHCQCPALSPGEQGPPSHLPAVPLHSGTWGLWAWPESQDGWEGPFLTSLPAPLLLTTVQGPVAGGWGKAF